MASNVHELAGAVNVGLLIKFILKLVYETNFTIDPTFVALEFSYFAFDTKGACDVAAPFTSRVNEKQRIVLALFLSTKATCW